MLCRLVDLDPLDVVSFPKPSRPGLDRLLLGSIRNSLAIWPDYAFDTAFNRNTLFGIESVLINDPAGVRYMMATNAANYARPAVTPRIVRPLIGRGVIP